MRTIRTWRGILEWHSPFSGPPPYTSTRLMVPESDEAAFKRVQAGDHTAFAVLADRYQRRAFAVALRLLGNRADAEDAVQHAFLRLYESRAAYRSRWRLNTWFYRILTNTCIDQLRRARPTASLDGLDFSTADTPDRVLAERERDRLLRRLWRPFPSRHGSSSRCTTEKDGPIRRSAPSGESPCIR